MKCITFNPHSRDAGNFTPQICNLEHFAMVAILGKYPKRNSILLKTVAYSTTILPNLENKGLIFLDLQ